jgi:hypothetical protein
MNKLEIKKLMHGCYPQSMNGFVEAISHDDQKEAAKAAAALATKQSKKRKFAEL